MKKKRNNIPYNLHETELIIKFGQLMASLIERRDSYDEKGKIFQKEDYVFSIKDEYSEKIFKIAMNIVNAYKQLEFIPIFIRRFPLAKFYSENGINHPQYLQYHYENHFLKISTIFDLSVILVGEIYRLGIPARLTSLNQLQSNYHTKNSLSVKVLKQFDKNIQGIKTIRNSIIHRADFFDREISDVDIYFYLWQDNPIENNDDMIANVKNKLLKTKMKDLIKSKQLTIQHNSIEINKTINKLFDVVLIEFELQYNKL